MLLLITPPPLPLPWQLTNVVTLEDLCHLACRGLSVVTLAAYQIQPALASSPEGGGTSGIKTSSQQRKPRLGWDGK